MARTKTTWKARDFAPGAAPRRVPGQLELFEIEALPAEQLTAPSVAPIDEHETTPKTEENAAWPR
jgi:hypothetical protein